jgi:hypothetical protein
LAQVVLTLFLLLRREQFFPLHCAALARGDEGVLFIGPSDSGKSTTAYLLVRQGWAFLSDDSVLLHPSPQGVEALAFRRRFALDADARDLFPEIEAYWRAQLADIDKRSVDVGEIYPEQVRKQCRPRLLIFPELTDREESVLLPLSPTQTFLQAVGQSALVTVRRDWTAPHLELVNQLLRQSVAYRLLAGRDLLSDRGRIVELVDGVWPHAPKVIEEHGAPA